MGERARIYERSLADPDAFWLEAAELIDWVVSPSRALDDTEAPLFKWFPDGVLNTCANALDRHVDNGFGERTALIWDPAMVPAKKSFTYRELRDEVARVAGALTALGVGKGDRVIVYMPMIPEAVMTMLACARLCSPVLASALCTRWCSAGSHRRSWRPVSRTRPKVVVAASCGLEPTRVVAYLKAGAAPDQAELRAELVAAVRRDVGPVAAFRDVAIVPALPKTRSGKILRKTMRGIADGRDEPVPPTIEDASVLDALTTILRDRP